MDDQAGLDELEGLRYPTGRWRREGALDAAARAARIAVIAAAPGELRRAVEGLDGERLDTPYRPGGWTVRQLVHHVPDSHLNAYVRVRWALTEDRPAIKTYDEKRWAGLPDARAEPEVSLALLDALHRRWLLLLEALAPEDFARPLVHPELGEMTIDDLVSLYAWHGRHHTAHVTALRNRMDWL
jgi:uncharacterized damage-inducible protein DinB